MQIEELSFDERGLIPCIAQDDATGEVLMMAWMDAEAIRRTLADRSMWYWSRSRQEYWHKGDTSGNTQALVSLYYDCDADALLARINPAGPACHTGHTSCFYRRLDQTHDQTPQG